jgi:hypothetical protein
MSGQWNANMYGAGALHGDMTHGFQLIREDETTFLDDDDGMACHEFLAMNPAFCQFPANVARVFNCYFSSSQMSAAWAAGSAGLMTLKETRARLGGEGKFLLSS